LICQNLNANIVKRYQILEEGHEMARKCIITGKGPMSGNNRSHSLRATRRKWGVNLQKVKLEIDGKVQTVRISTRALKTLKKAG
jgi:large subunit ribosomal protein L28